MYDDPKSLPYCCVQTDMRACSKGPCACNQCTCAPELGARCSNGPALAAVHRLHSILKDVEYKSMHSCTNVLPC